MLDLVSVALLGASAFFVVLSIGLLFRYRQVSKHISSSSDIGSNLWRALEARLKKQDERILDMMGRVEVIQARAVQGGVEESQVSSHVSSEVTPRMVLPSSSTSEGLYRSLDSRLVKDEESLSEVVNRLELIQSHLNTSHIDVAPVPAQRLSSASETRFARSGSKDVEILKMLGERARTSVEIRRQFDVTREHSARMLKNLFDKGLVVRNDSHKPFVYGLTEAGRRYLASRT